MEQLCRWMGISRQAHYQQQKRQAERQSHEEPICQLVRQWRQRHPRLGGRKLLHCLRPVLQAKGWRWGRDRFFALLRRRGLLVARQRAYRRTTWAGRRRMPNLLPQTTLQKPHQAWVVDITYLTTEKGFCYLSLITDAYSRYIVGYEVSNSLATDGSLRALRRALRQRPLPHHPLIHHSDHGFQYTDRRYQALLKKHQVRSSMGEVGNCYDNALAERMNGILKIEYGLDSCFRDIREARQAVREGIYLYNHERPHLALGYQTPSHFHQVS